MVLPGRPRFSTISASDMSGFILELDDAIASSEDAQAEVDALIITVGGKADISALTNAIDTLNAAIALKANLTSLNAHVGTTTAHGTFSPIVGTTDNQTLTNKTLAAPAITSPTGLVSGDVGLGNVDNTSDVNKPVSTAQSTALAGKAATSHTHAGTDISTGTVNFARLPSGATSATLATGDRGLPTGGTTGQVLAKNSGTNYDMTWALPGRNAVGGINENSTGLNVTSGSAIFNTLNITLPADGNYLVSATGFVEQYGATGAASPGTSTLYMTIAGNTTTSGATLTNEDGVDSPKLQLHQRTVAGTGSPITITFGINWLSNSIYRQWSKLMVTAIPCA